MLVFLASLAAGLLGAMGLGGGSLLLLYLTLVRGEEQLVAQGINLLFYIPCAGLALFFHTRNRLVRWRLALGMAAWGMLGVWVGWSLSGFLDTIWLARVLGGLLILTGVKEFFSKAA